MKNKTTIVHIIPKLYLGGAERLVALYGALHDYDQFDVHIVACVEDGALRSQIEETPAQLFVASRATYGGRWGAWKALKDHLDTIQPDIIHTHLLTSDVIGWWYCRQAKKWPIWISTQHNVEDSRPWLHRRLWRHILPQADAVVAVSPRVYRYARDVFRVPETHLHEILNGIDTSKWIPASMHPPQMQEPLRIATIGRLAEQKGHVYALAALAALPETLAWQYHLYGDGELEASLRDLATQYGIADRLVWHGAVTDMEAHIATIDIIVQPSLFEGLSLVILEALTAGRCVVTTPPGGEGVIEHGDNGYIVPIGDSLAIRDIIVQIASDRVAAQHIAVRAHDLAIPTYDIRTNVDTLEKLYYTLLFR